MHINAYIHILDKKQENQGGPDIAGTLISIMISVIIGVICLPIITNLVQVAKGEKITNTTAIAPTPATNPSNALIMPNIGDPNTQLVLLVVLLFGVLVLVFWSIWKARSKERYNES